MREAPQMRVERKFLVFSCCVGGITASVVFGDFFQASREPSPDPNAEETGAEKEQPAEKNKQEKNAEPKQVQLNNVLWLL